MTSKPLAWTDRALDDLEQIVADDPVAAEQWVEGLLAVAQCAAELPMSGWTSKAELVATGVFAVNFMCCPCAVHVLCVHGACRRSSACGSARADPVMRRGEPHSPG